MQFTKLTKSKPYTDIICVGISVSSQPYQFSSNSKLLNIHGFHTIHLKGKGNALRQHGDIITWDTVDLFDCITNYLDTGNNTIIVCNHSLVAIGSSDFTDMLERGCIRISNSVRDSDEFGYGSDESISTECFIASSPPTILMFTSVRTGKKYTFVDIGNYGIDYISDVFDNLSAEDKSLVHNEAELGVSEDNSLTCAGLIARFMQEFYRIVTEHKLGGLSITYSSQGMRAFRSRFYSGNILPHTDDTAIIVDKGCYLGGRVEDRYHGHYSGKVYLLDVQSLYPSIAVRRSLPTSLSHTTTSPSRKAIEEWLSAGIIGAYCHIETDRPIYPVKVNEQLRFPVGNFNCFLIADEFTEAYHAGHIKHIYQANFYNSERILKDYSSYMLGLRTAYKGGNNRLAEYIVKLITNGTWGKFGQTGNTWVVDEAEIPDRPYGGYIKHGDNNNKGEQYRIINWQVSRLTHTPFPNNTFPPISACMNAYSRMYIWSMMQCAGLHNVLYVAVDGLIVTQDGKDRLENHIARNPYEYGKLKVSEQGDFCDIQGYGKYAIGTKTVLQGTPRKDSKRYSGFWSTLDYISDDIKQEILSGDTVMSRYHIRDLRDKLRAKEGEPGHFTVQDSLYDTFDPYTSLSSLHQADLFHYPEWLR